MRTLTAQELFDEYGLNLGSPNIQSLMNNTKTQSGFGNSEPSDSSSYYQNGEAYSSTIQQQMYNQNYYPQQQYNIHTGYYQQPVQQNPYYNQQMYNNQYYYPQQQYQQPVQQTSNPGELSPMELQQIFDSFNTYYEEWEKQQPLPYFKTAKFKEKFYSITPSEEQIDRLNQDRQEYEVKRFKQREQMKKDYIDKQIAAKQKAYYQQQDQIGRYMNQQQQYNNQYGYYQQPVQQNHYYNQQMYNNQYYQMPQYYNTPTHYSSGFMPCDEQPKSKPENNSFGQGTIAQNNAQPQQYYLQNSGAIAEFNKVFNPADSVAYYNPEYNYQYNSFQTPDQSTETVYDAEMVKKMYESGIIGKSEYASYANAGFEHIAEDGTLLFSGAPVGYGSWGGGISFGYPSQKEMEMMKEQQEIAERNNKAFDIARRVVNKALGIDPLKQKIKQAKIARYFASVNAKRQKNAMIEAEQDAFVSMVKRFKYSDEPGYLSPLKQKILEHFNETWERRHKGIPENYTFDEFTTKGIFMDIMYNDRKWENHTKRKELCKMYSTIGANLEVAMRNPFFSPEGYNMGGGITLSRNGIDVTLPPELAQSNYNKRRDFFFKCVGNHQVENDGLMGTTEYLNRAFAY